MAIRLLMRGPMAGRNRLTRCEIPCNPLGEGDRRSLRQRILGALDTGAFCICIDDQRYPAMQIPDDARQVTNLDMPVITQSR